MIDASSLGLTPPQLHVPTGRSDLAINALRTEAPKTPDYVSLIFDPNVVPPVTEFPL